MRIIQRSLDTQNSEHVMSWAACCPGFFGFLRAGEFTVNPTFDPSIHLTVQDLQVDAEVNPSSLRVCIKSSKTDPFRQGCFILGSLRNYDDDHNDDLKKNNRFNDQDNSSARDHAF